VFKLKVINLWVEKKPVRSERNDSIVHEINIGPCLYYCILFVCVSYANMLAYFMESNYNTHMYVLYNITYYLLRLAHCMKSKFVVSNFTAVHPIILYVEKLTNETDEMTTLK